ncbi:unnamed protein product [Sympodiomycopsis kandeliae]
MDLNKHNPDPHNVQYLLSVLRGDQPLAEREQPPSNDIKNYQGHGVENRQEPSHAAADPRKRPAPTTTTSSADRSTNDSASAPQPESQSNKRLKSTPVEATTTADKVASQPKTRCTSSNRKLESIPACLSKIRSLSRDPKFLRLLMSLKRQQDTLERALKYEYDELVSNNSGSRQVEEWKREALERWDEQLTLQQNQLGTAGLPNFYQSQSKIVRDAQRQVLDVLSGMVGQKSKQAQS